ncbi:hypothetical protein T12_3326 [Trichinella patagoniensis]|uniref:Uncharacterized protein n=1 Tax=Trichinella patagoniensis TaxID=990121 RepID=A0A0V1AGJ7_9BILA|nr:hypothetical protein T12_3326 [Trichinella patagoniensis]
MELPYYGILEKAFHLALQHMQWKHNLLKIKNSFSISSHNYCRKHAMNENKECQKKSQCYSCLLYFFFHTIPSFKDFTFCSIDRANLSVTD